MALLMMTMNVGAQTKRALVIGLGQQQDKEWNKINGDKDVVYVKRMLHDAGFRNIKTLVNQQATKVGIVDAFKNITEKCQQGDIVYIHYSGHGQQMRDVHNDEADGLDECWIPFDAYQKSSKTYHGEKHLTDDEINYHLNRIRDKVGEKGKILVVVDACHCGDSTRGKDNDSIVVRGIEDIFEPITALIAGVTKRVKKEHSSIKPHEERWITISACQSYQVNYEMKAPAVGKLTYALYNIIKEHCNDNNGALMQRMRRLFKSPKYRTKASQTPIMTGDDQYKYNVTEILHK